MTKDVFITAIWETLPTRTRRLKWPISQGNHTKACSAGLKPSTQLPQQSVRAQGQGRNSWCGWNTIWRAWQKLVGFIKGAFKTRNRK